MPSFSRDDLRLFTLVTSDKARFLFAEFIDEYDTLSMGFFKFSNGMYELVGLPEGFKPSFALSAYLWDLLETNDAPPLAIPGGYYYGDEYHTKRGIDRDSTVLQGVLIEEIIAPDGKNYCLVVSQHGSDRVAYFAHFAGTVNRNTPNAYDLWMPTPVPQSILNDNTEMLGLYCAADIAQANLMVFTAKLN